MINTLHSEIQKYELSDVMLRRIADLHPHRSTPPSTKEGSLPFMIRLIQHFFQVGGQLFPGIMARYGFHLFTRPRKRAKHFRDDEILLMARRSTFQYKKMELVRYDWGDQGNPRVLLVHGWESRATALRHFVEPLLERSYHVTALDAPAHGDSPGSSLNMITYARILADFWQKFNDIEAVVAHSLGGSAAVYALSHYLPNYRIPKLITVGSPATAEGMLDGFLDFVKAPKRMRAAFYRLIAYRAGHDIQQLDYQHSYNSNSVEKVLLIHDTADPLVAFEEALIILKSWPNTMLIPTTGYGHYGLIKIPSVIKLTVNFIDGDRIPTLV